MEERRLTGIQVTESGLTQPVCKQGKFVGMMVMVLLSVTVVFSFWGVAIRRNQLGGIHHVGASIETAGPNKLIKVSKSDKNDKSFADPFHSSYISTESEIYGSLIENNGGDGILFEGGLPLTVNKSNILNNGGYGINNLDASTAVHAGGNWWGDASGPGGQGSGSGDKVSSNVNFTNWRSSPVSLVAFAGTDTAFVPIGQTDSVYCGVQNWENLNDAVDVSIEGDSAGWVTSQTEFSLELQDSLGAATFIEIHVPSTAECGTSNMVKITAVSQSDPTKTEVDSFYVVSYRRYLSRIKVNPEMVLIRAGQGQQFTATGYDSVGIPIDIDVAWSATGGTIDSAGFYIAGSDTGRFSVTAQDTVSQLTDSAELRVLPMLSNIEISPDDTVLEQGESLQFTVQGYDSLGAGVEVLEVWSSTGGTIDPTGLYTAGSDTGFYMVAVKDSLTHVADTAVVHITTATEIEEKDKQIVPKEFSMRQNYPNPFNPITTIEFSVKEKCHVVMKVYDITGRETNTLIDENYDPGSYEINFNARNLASSIYFYRIQMKDFVKVKKMVLLK